MRNHWIEEVFDS